MVLKMIINVVVKVNKKNNEMKVIAMYKEIEKALAFVNKYKAYGFYGYKLVKKEVADNLVLPMYA